MEDRSPGWDSRAIKRIADEYYGGYKGMFEHHGWPERGSDIMPGNNGRIKEHYGSIEAFVSEHPFPRPLSPLDSIKADPPNVWLKSFYGFSPQNWGFLGFTKEKMRNSFLSRSRPGALVVIYGASKAPIRQQRGRILGLLEMSHQVGTAEEFMTPEAYAAKQADPKRRGKWNYAVKATRAWAVTPSSAPEVQDFAPITYSRGRSQTIGAQGMILHASEAKEILNFDLFKVPVFGSGTSKSSEVEPATEALRPSKAGPVSQEPWMGKEAEGPKHLYILELCGNAEAFLGRPAVGKRIIKVGFSVNPEKRRNDHNKTLPAGVFKWRVLHSTALEGLSPFPSSKHGKCGERSLKADLGAAGESLGGEFFLADDVSIQEAWLKGKDAASKWSSE